MSVQTLRHSSDVRSLGRVTDLRFALGPSPRCWYIRRANA